MLFLRLRGRDVPKELEMSALIERQRVISSERNSRTFLIPLVCLLPALLLGSAEGEGSKVPLIALGLAVGGIVFAVWAYLRGLEEKSMAYVLRSGATERQRAEAAFALAAALLPLAPATVQSLRYVVESTTEEAVVKKWAKHALERSEAVAKRDS